MAWLMAGITSKEGQWAAVQGTWHHTKAQYSCGRLEV